MKTIVLIYITLLLSLSIIQCLRISSDGKTDIFEDDESSISYRTSAFDNKKKIFTTIKPDSNSSPLKLSKEQIGRFSWAILHSMAAAYPKIPNQQDKENFHMFLHSFAKLFPCKKCSKHFQQMLAEFPIKNNSREELVYYLCDMHNKVNEKLKKRIFDCKKAFGFWGGECGCAEKTSNTTITENRIVPIINESKDVKTEVISKKVMNITAEIKPFNATIEISKKLENKEKSSK